MSDDFELAGYTVDEATGEIIPVEPNKPVDPPKTIRGSVSLINDYRSCPAKAYGRITRQPQEKGVALVQGIAVHEALEKYAKYEADPAKTFESALVYEAQRNELDLDGKKGEEARRVGGACVAAGVSILNHKGTTGVELYKRMDKNYIERGFTIMRDGRKYVGKIDFVMHLQDDINYVIGDWKTGKTAPDEWKLKSDLQFSMYAYAAFNDPGMERTHGVWLERGVYMHLRGQSTEMVASGARRKSVKDSDPSKVRFDFPTKRTPEQVEQHFTTTIEPVMAQMEAGVWWRNLGDDCKWCGYWNKELERCEVEIPLDGGNRAKLERERQEALRAKQPPDMLFDKSVITDSRKAGLKPYS